MWAYNDIDVYLSPSDNILGETSVATQNWVPLSTYGLLRSRVALTPSTVEGNALTIPAKDGKSYSIDSGRGNAKLEFEVLIADEWVHKDLNSNVRTRTDMVASLLNRARRIAYKQPGRSANSYFIIYKTTLTINDADEKVSSIKAQMEVHPFEFFLSGNTAVSIAVNGTYTIDNGLPFSDCYPSVVCRGDGEVQFTANGVTTSLWPINTVPENTVADAFLNMAYDKNTKDNRNQYFNSDFKIDMRIPGGASVVVTNRMNYAITLYTRKGIVK